MKLKLGKGRVRHKSSPRHPTHAKQSRKEIETLSGIQWPVLLTLADQELVYVPWNVRPRRRLVICVSCKSLHVVRPLSVIVIVNLLSSFS